MISLPPGCTINYEVTVVVHEMPEEFLAWWKDIGGEVAEKFVGWDKRGQEQIVPTIRYSANSRWSHKSAGNLEYLIRFRAEDANVALMMLMKWSDLVVHHNMREVEDMKERHGA